MRSVGNIDAVSVSILDDNIITSDGPVASVVCEEKVVEPDDVNTTTTVTSSCSVALPHRYQLKLQSMKGREMISQSQGSRNKLGDDLNSREKDLGAALKWIRQEILQMKEQDKSLMKQFINLRSTILQIRCMYEYHSSNSDISSLDGSTASLNDGHLRNQKLSVTPSGDCDFLDLSSRARSLLNLPGVTGCTKIRWKSDEYI